MTRRRTSGDDGQATVEFLALVPLLAAVAITILLLLAGYGAREAADQAAVAAAAAQLQGTDAEGAAQDASPSWSRAHVAVAKGRVTVTIEPRLPALVAEVVDAHRSVVFDAAVAGPDERMTFTSTAAAASGGVR